jgi:hypothetical protein
MPTMSLLVFDNPSWSVFRSKTDSRGTDTDEMVTEALAKSLRPIIADTAKN